MFLPSSNPFVFDMFNIRPETSENRFCSSFSIGILFSDCKNMVVLSANWVNFISWFLPIFIPLIVLLFLIFSAIISADSMYNNAEIGQPCLIPREIVKLSETQPLFVTLLFEFL